MSKSRSIGERMQRAKALALRRQIALDWAAHWRRDHEDTIRRLEIAVGQGRMADAGQCVGQIKEALRKMHDALPGVIGRLTEDRDDDGQP